VVKLELERFGLHDINNVQAMMLFNIGDAEMTVGELTLRGCYLRSNVSYNVKKRVENEYLAHERSVHDRRSIHVRLTEKGIKLRDSLIAMPNHGVGDRSDPSRWHRFLRPRLGLFSPDARTASDPIPNHHQNARCAGLESSHANATCARRMPRAVATSATRSTTFWSASSDLANSLW
jgi:DNA-binding MarR family transcriptional regulator